MHSELVRFFQICIATGLSMKAMGKFACHEPQSWKNTSLATFYTGLRKLGRIHKNFRSALRGGTRLSETGLTRRQHVGELCFQTSPWKRAHRLLCRRRIKVFKSGVCTDKQFSVKYCTVVLKMMFRKGVGIKFSRQMVPLDWIILNAARLKLPLKIEISKGADVQRKSPNLLTQNAQRRKFRQINRRWTVAKTFIVLG